MIGGASTCPSPSSVWAELGTLVPSERLTEYVRAAPAEASPSASSGSPLSVEIVDLGSRYRVLAANRVREYRDDHRDCAARARVAAVFVALAFGPGDAAPPVSPPAEPTPAAPPPDRPAAVREARDSRLDIGPSADAGLDAGTRPVHLGGAVRLALGRGAVALVIGVFVPFALDTEVGGLRVSQWRLPGDLGLRLRLAGYGVEPYGELGVSAAVISERALDLATSLRSRAVELGPYVAAGARFFASARIAPFVAVRAEWVPSPSGVQSLPRDLVGHTPRFWMGATVGASLGF